jgi:hypothetical protein
MVDPYYLSQREVVTGISTLRSMLENRKDILTDSRGGNPEIFKSIGDRMREQLNTVAAFWTTSLPRSGKLSRTARSSSSAMPS